MPTRVVNTKYFHFRQNNSGGSFDIDDKRGIGVDVWIEAASAEDAIARAESLGIYFNGCESGVDCPCCGDRWSFPWEESDDPIIDPKYSFAWNDTVYIHTLDGAIRRITREGRTP